MQMYKDVYYNYNQKLKMTLINATFLYLHYERLNSKHLSM